MTGQPLVLQVVSSGRWPRLPVGHSDLRRGPYCVAATNRACRTCDMPKTTAHVQLDDSVDPELLVLLHYMQWYKSRTGRT